MIVMAIVALLAAIAYPSYQNQVRKSNRSDGHIALTTAAQQLERCYTINGAYDQAAGCTALSADDTLSADLATSPENNYTLAANTQATTFLLTATPVNAQSRIGDDECPRLTLNQQGQKGVLKADGTNDPAAVDRCW